MNQISLPLSALDASEHNVRKTGGASIEDLAANIRAVGLLHNIVVRTGARGRYEIIDGARRVAALHQLIAEGHFPDSYKAPCNIIANNTDEGATEASLSANLVRENMHPADQFLAFDALVRAGKSVEDIAADFCLPVVAVQRSLKLANLHPQFIQMFREGHIKMDQLQALAITDDHEAQHQAWFGAAHDWQRSSHELRSRLTVSEIRSTDKLARFVGVEAYEAAGGTVRRDLFSDHAWFQDPTLLKRVADQKLQDLTDRESAAGWEFVNASLDNDLRDQFSRKRGAPDPERDFATEEDRARDQAIGNRIAEIEEIDADDVDQDENNRLADELDRLEFEQSEIEARAIETWPDDIKAASGVLICVGHDGAPIILRAMVPNGGKSSESAKSSGKKEKAKPKKAELSDAVRETLRAHLSEQVRANVMENSRIALALMIDELHSWHVHDFGASGLLHFSHTSLGREPSEAAKDLRKSTQSEIADCIKDLAQIPKGKQRLRWLLDRTEAQLLELFTVLVGTRFNASNPTSDDALELLHSELGIFMNESWSPNCDNYLARIPRELVLEAVAEARGKPATAALAPLKKDALVAEAAKQLAGTGWLPKPLRGPGYSLDGAKPAVQASTKTSTAAKKAKPAKNAKAKPKAMAKKTATKKPAKK